MMDPSVTQLRVRFRSTCNISRIRQILTDKMNHPEVRMTPSLPDDCDAKGVGRVLRIGMRGRQGGCGSPDRRDCAGRRREARESRRGCCFGKDGVYRLRELDVVLGLGLREWVGFFGRRLT